MPKPPASVWRARRRRTKAAATASASTAYSARAMRRLSEEIFMEWATVSVMG
jgi:hypothetical protein